MEEIVNSVEMEIIEDFVMARIEVWDAILKYLLAVNLTTNSTIFPSCRELCSDPVAN
jgi:hypothetical protein